MTLAPGSRLGPYEILALIGAGGMGEVYRALDARLGREVAVKVLPAELVADPDRLRRFNLEAKAAAQLEHPNIGVVHEIDEVNGTTFIVMELIRGEKFSETLADGRLSLPRALGLATEIAEGMARAHEKGIVHRDLKPANVMVTEDGHAKIIDFGLAKLVEPVEAAASNVETATRRQTETETGAVLGTPAYMSPEQARGQRVDFRSDVFSFGVMLYEMLTGGLPFRGPSRVETLHAILNSPAPPLNLPSGEDAPDLKLILDKCLAKDPAERYQGTRDLVVDLRAARRRLESGSAPPATLPSAPPARGPLRRPWLVVAALLLLLAALAVGIRFSVQVSRGRWARNVALPEVVRLAKEERMQAAFRLARQAAMYLPDDAQLQQQIKEMTHVTSIDSDPSGARAYFADYVDPKAEWELAGTTPIKETQVPFGLLRWKLAKEGFEESVTLAWAGGGSLHFRLFPKGTVPPGMVAVPAGRSPQWWPGAKSYELEDYWLDRYEVTNADFKRFVDAGGYEKEDNWKEPFVEAGRTLSWREAMARFKDKTGRSGPATWTLGSFPEGDGDRPVGGVSWYEAAAFAAFAGKSLPTVHHWSYAAGFASESVMFSEIWRLSNFGSKGPSPVSRSRGLTQFGTYDMAGNVKEWCWNAAGQKRYILGGAWNETAYLFGTPDAAPPFERSPTYGFRCARYGRAPSPEVLAPFEMPTQTTWDPPVGDETFRVYKDLYAYERRDLRPVLEHVEETSYWRHETVSFDAAYADERVLAHLLLPKHARPPYQTVIYFPDGWAPLMKSSRELEMHYLSFIVRSGRAVLFPVYKGTYERRAKSLPANVFAEWTIDWAKDLARSIDYLETRKDIDSRRIAFYGVSMGAASGPVFAVVEKRLKTMILLGGGLLLPFEKVPPQVDPLNFAPRTRIPILMVNGKDDLQLKDASRRMFDLLGTPPEHKRLALLEGGHMAAHFEDVIREILDWLDRYLGPVERG